MVSQLLDRVTSRAKASHYPTSLVISKQPGRCPGGQQLTLQSFATASLIFHPMSVLRLCRSRYALCPPGSMQWHQAVSLTQKMRKKGIKHSPSISSLSHGTPCQPQHSLSCLQAASTFGWSKAALLSAPSCCSPSTGSSFYTSCSY